MLNSKLDTYIQSLLSDDNLLKQFIANPMSSESEPHGLTKAERSVLRRVVQHLPATAKSAFSMVRPDPSYRRSLRLLQNVLHNSASKMHTNVLKSSSDVTASVQVNSGSQNGGTFHLYVYYPNGGTQDYTCEQNSAVEAQGGPYANHRSFQIVFGSGSTTIERLVLGASQAFPQSISYKTVPAGDGPVISEITIDGNAIKADLSNDCYATKKADNVFWFYTINGLPNHGGVSGQKGTSFAKYPLKDGDTVFLQLIAPDKQYGFQPCV